MPGPTLLVSPTAPSRQRGEERALFARLREGDASSREALVRRYLPLAHKLAHVKTMACAGPGATA